MEGGLKGGISPPLGYSDFLYPTEMSRCSRCVIRGSGYVKPDVQDTTLNIDLQAMLALRAQQDTKYFPSAEDAKQSRVSGLKTDCKEVKDRDVGPDNTH